VDDASCRRQTDLTRGGTILSTIVITTSTVVEVSEVQLAPQCVEDGVEQVGLDEDATAAMCDICTGTLVAVDVQEGGNFTYHLAEFSVHGHGIRVVNNAAGDFGQADPLEQVRHLRRLRDGKFGAQHTLNQVRVVDIARLVDCHLPWVDEVHALAWATVPRSHEPGVVC